MPVPKEEGGVVVSITGTADEVEALNEHNHMLACAELAGRITDADYVVTYADYVLFGRGKVDTRTLEMYYMHLVAALTPPQGTLEVDLSMARTLARTTEEDHTGRWTGRYVDTLHTLDAKIRLGDLVARRDELFVRVEGAEAYHASKGKPGPQANLRFGLEFIDFATAIVALKARAAV